MAKECPTCGNTVEDRDDMCPICGENLSISPPVESAQKPTEDVECPGCMSLVPQGTAECPVCGEKMGAAAVAPAESPSPQTASNGKECPSCGVDVDSTSAECPVCGYNFTGAAPVQAAAEEPVKEIPEPTTPIPAEETAVSKPEAIEPKLCPSCGVEVETDMIECPVCGYKLEYDGLPPMDKAPPAEEPELPPLEIPREEEPAAFTPVAPSVEAAPPKKPAAKAKQKPKAEPTPEPAKAETPPEDKGGLKCPSCGKPVTDDMAVCTSCFTRLRATPEEAAVLQVSGEVTEAAELPQAADEKECLVCGALLAETEDICPICRIPFGTEIKEPPEEETEWETVGITVRAEKFTCPNCNSFITDSEELENEHNQQKWFLRAILAIFAGIFLTSASVWAHGVTTENLSRGMAPMPLDWVINICGWVLVALGAIFWFKSWRDAKEHAIACPSCGETVMKAATTCPSCGKGLEGGTCATCGAEMPADVVACPDCGAQVQTQTGCANCGAALPEGAAECAECGQKVGEEQPAMPIAEGAAEASCPTCGNVVPMNARECPNCGEKFANGNGNGAATGTACPICGASVAADAKECKECGQVFS